MNKKMNRKHFISTLATAAATTVVGAKSAFAHSANSSLSSASLNLAASHKVKRGVALYSYQQTMMLNGMTLEDMLEECSSIGAYGIECIGQVFIKNYPNPSDRWIEEWWNLNDKYGTIPVCYTDFHDRELRRTSMTIEENLEYLTRDMKLARKMGLTKLRMLIGTPGELFEAAAPVAEKLGVWMGMELHAPVTLKGKLVEARLKIAEKFPDAFGFIPDMGMFSKYPRPYTRDQAIKKGTLTREIALYIEQSFKSGMDKAEVAKKVAGMKPKPGDTGYVEQVYRNRPEDPENLLPIMKYCRHIHGKFYEMAKGTDYNDTQILYNEVIPVLIQGGYEGYICSEYEGQRSMEIADVDEIDEVRRQHMMLKRLLEV
jgi:hypothetical protein